MADDGRTTMIVLFIISFCFGLMGYPSAAYAVGNSLFGGAGFATFGGIQIVLMAFMGAIGILVLPTVAAGALTSNFGQIYTIPMAIVGVVLVIMFVPLSFITEPTIPLQIRTLMGFIFGGLILSAVLGFIRGGGF